MFIIQNKRGFTLLEILIALFIFSILSLILARALQSVMVANADTEKKAERLHALQIAMLVLSRDVEQAVNRPVLNAAGIEDAAFVGDGQQFTLTHLGAAALPHTERSSTLQRVQYSWGKGSHRLDRRTTAVVDLAPASSWQVRCLLKNVERIDIGYLDKDKHFHRSWPVTALTDQPLPRAIQLTLSLSSWGSISELYVLATEPNQAPAARAAQS